jgi:hypothetical protein
MEISKKVHQSIVPLLSIYLKEYKAIYKTPIFIAASYIITNLWNQSKYPITDQWIKKMWYIYTMEYYSVIRKNEIMLFAGKYMDLKTILLSKINQTQKDKHHVLLISGI